MLQTNFSIYDLTVNGFKMTFRHVRLFILTMLTCIGLIVAAIFGMLVIVSPTLIKIWNMLPSIKQVMAAIGIKTSAGIIQGGMSIVQGGMQMIGGLLPGGSSLMRMSEGSSKAAIIAQFVKHVEASFTTIDYVLFVLAVLFFTIVLVGLVIGFLRIVLDVVDTGNSTVSRILSCFHMVPRFFAASIMGTIVIGLGLIFFIVPGIILMLRLYCFPYYIIDKNMGALESLKASFRATKGLVWDLLGLNILAAGIASFIPVFGIPVACFMLAGVYRVLPRH